MEGRGPDLLLVCGGRLGLHPASGRGVGWRVPTCGDYEPRIFCLPLVLVFAPHRRCSDVPDMFPMACDRRLATTGKGVVLRVPTCGLPHTSSKSDRDPTLPHRGACGAPSWGGRGGSPALPSPDAPLDACLGKGPITEREAARLSSRSGSQTATDRFDGVAGGRHQRRGRGGEACACRGNAPTGGECPARERLHCAGRCVCVCVCVCVCRFSIHIRNCTNCVTLWSWVTTTPPVPPPIPLITPPPPPPLQAQAEKGTKWERLAC